MKNELLITDNELEFDQHKFYLDIREAETLAEKTRVMNKALNQEAILVKNMKKELEAKGQRAGKNHDWDYIPIEVVEEGLRQIFFRQIDFIIVDQRRELNTYVVHSRLQYVDPITGQQRVVDGLAGKSMQQDANSKISEFNETLKWNGIEMAVGYAYSRSIKNAAKKLGKAFGASLNRDEELESVSMFKRSDQDELLHRLQKLFILKLSSINEADVPRIKEIIEQQEASSYRKVIKELENL